MSDSRGTNAEDRVRIDRDRETLELIRRAQLSREDIAKQLFFEHFDRIEATIKRRLCLHGKQYDAGSVHYNEVFNKVYDRVYAPDALLNAVKCFEPEKGALDAWLLGRVVFAVRDWLKTSERADVATTSLQADPPDMPSHVNEMTESDGCLETALAEMTASQHAATVLRLLPTRPATQEDLTVVCEVAQRDRYEIERRLETLAVPDQASEMHQRETQLFERLAVWHMRRLHLRRKHTLLRRHMRKNGETETAIAVMERHGAETTHAGIKEFYRADSASRTSFNDMRMVKERFELCCRDLARCERRIREIQDEYSGAPLIPLLSYEQIAEVLGSTIARVNAYLNRARKKIEETEKRRNVT